MARRILIVDPVNHCSYGIEDPRAQTHLPWLIHTGVLAVEEKNASPAMKLRKGVGSITGHPVLVIVLNDPPVQLSGRHYEVLVNLARGHKCSQVARTLGISRRTVYAYLDDLKRLFKVQTRGEVLVQAACCGLLENPNRGEGLFQKDGQE